MTPVMACQTISKAGIKIPVTRTVACTVNMNIPRSVFLAAVPGLSCSTQFLSTLQTPLLGSKGYRSHLGENPSSLSFDPPALPDGSRVALPVAVMAGNRPHYLLRMLRSLRDVHGLEPSMVTVYIDGFYEEPLSVTRMFGIAVEQHAGASRLNSRICQVRFTPIVIGIKFLHIISIHYQSERL